MMNISSIIQQCQHQRVELSLNEKGGIHFKSATGKIKNHLKSILIENKSEIVQYLRTSPADKTDIASIPKNKSEPIDSPRIFDANNKTLTHQDISIIRSYPTALHELLTTLLHVRDGKYAEMSLRQQDLENFRHNMRWFFVSIEYYIKGWHPADVRTLWSDGWRAQEIIRFMASRKVKYILCHNDKIIQCLDLNNRVYVFEKKRSSLSEHKPVEEIA